MRNIISMRNGLPTSKRQKELGHKSKKENRRIMEAGESLMERIETVEITWLWHIITMEEE